MHPGRIANLASTAVQAQAQPQRALDSLSTRRKPKCSARVRHMLYMLPIAMEPPRGAAVP